MTQKVGTERKTLGRRGELTLDGAMSQLGWDCVVANRSFRGGEIDRIYRSSHVGGAACSSSEAPVPSLIRVAPPLKKGIARTDSLARVAREAVGTRTESAVTSLPGKPPVEHGPSYCVAEVKTLCVRHARTFDTLVGGDFLARALRFTQLRNLALCARLLSMQGVRKVHVRVFRVFVFLDAKGAQAALENLRARFAGNTCVRVLDLAEGAVALSLVPDFVPRGQRSHPLQVEISG